MNELTNLCGGDVAGSDLAALRDACRHFGAAFDLPVLELVLLVVFAVVGFLAVAASRSGKGAGVILGNGFEGAVYGALGFYAGSTFALVAASLVPPLWFAWTVLATCVAALVFVIVGVAGKDADGDAGSKLTAVVLGLLLVGAGSGILALAAAVPESGAAGTRYQTYLNVSVVVLGIFGGIDGVLTAGTRGVHWAIGWLLVPLNASWGFLGNILGLGTHFASYYCYGYGMARGGGVQTSRRQVHEPCSLYRRGLTLKLEPVAGGGPPQRYAFTQGWVVSCGQSRDIERHELWHVRQHLLLGPVYPVSHFAWVATGAAIGVVACAAGALGLRSKIHIGDALTNMSYFNNPYEIMAYATHSHGARSSSRPLIFRGWGAAVFAIVWVLGAVGGFLWLTIEYWN